MERIHVDIDAPAFGRAGSVIRYGHWGRPVIAFPGEAGRAWDFEHNGMVDAIRPLIDSGRVKLYCVDSFDDQTWSDRWLPLEERALRHRVYERWLTGPVLRWIEEDSPGATDAVVTGASMGAYHALHLTLTRADVFPVAICLSGNYDPSTWSSWGRAGDAAYFTNPTDYVADLGGPHLEWLRAHAHIVLVVGQGAWETHPTRALPSTRRMAALVADKGISHELDVWGHDVTHDWPWWQRELAYHLPRFC